MLVAAEALKNGKVKADGKEQSLLDLMALMAKFPFWFPIVTPTSPSSEPKPCTITS